MSDVCQHGSLRRQCEICDCENRIAELDEALGKLKVIAALEVEAEREACAQVALVHAKSLDNEWNRSLGKLDDLKGTAIAIATEIAAAIRARGDK